MSLQMELFFLFSLVIMGINLYSINGCFEMEKRALLTFKNGVNDHGNLLISWHDPDCCKWSGIACDDKTGHVTRLNISGSPEGHYLSGIIDPSLHNLRHLTHLDLSQNDFSNISIPKFIGSFENLIYLNLSGSYFRGIIDPSLHNLRHLTHLDLSLNDFSNISIPKFIGSFENLIYLDLSESYFRGGIPYQLGNLSKLRYLDLGFSNFIGIVPTQLGNLSNLQHLSLDNAYSFSEFHVDDISWISRLSSLKYLDMSYTNLSEVVGWSELNKLSSLETLILLECGLSSIPTILSHVNFTTLQILDLSFNSLNTVLPNWLFNLTNLLYLDLGMSNLYGKIPDAFSNLPLLNYLNLGWNNFDTTSFEHVSELNNLREIGLAGLGIRGDVADLIRRLSSRWNNLENVRLSGNNLHGNISSWITQMKNLSVLDLSDNSLSGHITHDIGMFDHLTMLDLSSNFLSGAIEEAHFAKLSKLTELSLSDNSLTMNVNDKWIPPFQLKTISLNSCKLGPRFPHWLRWQTQTSHVELSKTGIVGTIPNWFWTNVFIGYLDLSYNNITGNLPSSIDYEYLSLASNNFHGPLPNLSSYVGSLDLSNNMISGPFPIKMDLSEINLIWLSGNNISGTIPSYICDMQGLEILSLSNNILSGEIPSCLNNTILSMMDLSNNKLTGELPKSLGYLTSLQTLQLDNNMLYGEIPSTLKHCKNIIFLGLGRNKFSGKIPSWIGTSLKDLIIIQLRSNMFSGFIPRELGQLSYLHILDFAHNYLTGSVPSSFGNFSAMRNISQNIRPKLGFPIVVINQINSVGNFLVDFFTDIKGENLYSLEPLNQLTSIDLSGNNLSGQIPKEIGSLNYLISLNLSRNHFLGKIPDTIGSISSLEGLDLSINDLSGSIPQSFSNLTMLNHFNLSYNNLSGKIPYEGQLDTLNDPSTYIGNAYLCGPPTNKPCSGDGGTTFDIRVDKKGFEMPWLYYFIGGGFIFGCWCVCGVLMFHRVWRIAYFQILDKSFDDIYVKFVLTSRKWKHVWGK